MGFKEDIETRRKEVSSSKLTMSIGELLNLYQEGELKIRPEFQRVFRWDLEQKSRLIESILLGIPLPTVFVVGTVEGTWELLVGIQRLSVAFEFMGELSGPAGPDTDELIRKPAFALTGTKALPSLEGVTYESLGPTLRMEFKRSAFEMKYVAQSRRGALVDSFEFFERLNNYGEPLFPQERRHCILAIVNPQRFIWLQELAATPSFRANVLLSEAQLVEQVDMDLALRFLILRNVDVATIGYMHDVLRDEMERMARNTDYDAAAEAHLFREVFQFLDDKLDGNAFRTWNEKTETFRGGFCMAAFEGLAFALAKHWSDMAGLRSTFDLFSVVKALWATKPYRAGFAGLTVKERMAKVIPAAATVVRQEIKRLKPPVKQVVKRLTQ